MMSTFTIDACPNRHPDRRRRQRSHGRAINRFNGFTLIELLLAITLLAIMMGMIYASLNVGIRAWDAGDARVTEAANWRTVEHFMRREIGQIFPTRWRGVTTPNIGFDGYKNSLRYVTTLNLEASLQNGAAGGLQWAELTLTSDGTLQLNRQPFDSQAPDFGGLTSPSRDQAQSGNVIAPVRLMEAVSAFEIGYFGADDDVTEPTWRDEWHDTTRMPLLIRLKVSVERGRPVNDIVIAPKLGEEVGCLTSGFSRNCGARAK